MENLTPEVSVLLPVRQWRSTTLQAVESILNQTINAIELLVIGQTDVSTLTQRLPPDQRIRTISREEPGIVNALNTGLLHATAPFIARMDDDDVAYPERLSIQRNYLRNNPQVQLCGARVNIVDSNGGSAGVGNGSRRYAAWLDTLTDNATIKQNCYVESPLPHPSLFAHRDTWDQLQGYRQFDGPEDYDLILRAMLAGMGMGKPETVLMDWREHPERLTYSDSRYRRAAFSRCRARAAAHPDSGLDLHCGRAVWLCGTGPNARNWHDELECLGVAVQGFVDMQRIGPDRRKRDKPVIAYDELVTKRGNDLVITALPQDSARRELLSFFSGHGWLSGVDYILGA